MSIKKLSNVTYRRLVAGACTVFFKTKLYCWFPIKFWFNVGPPPKSLTQYWTSNMGKRVVFAEICSSVHSKCALFSLVFNLFSQECCNSPYGNNYFPEYAEPIPGESTESFAKSARDNNVFLVAGEVYHIYHETLAQRWFTVGPTS